MSDPATRVQFSALSDQIRTLRAEAGVSGISIARLDYSPHTTLYQRIGDLMPRLALLGLSITTLLAILPQRPKINSDP